MTLVSEEEEPKELYSEDYESKSSEISYLIFFALFFYSTGFLSSPKTGLYLLKGIILLGPLISLSELKSEITLELYEEVSFSLETLVDFTYLWEKVVFVNWSLPYGI